MPRLRGRRVDRAQRAGVLRVAVGVRPNGTFQVLEWRAAPAETTEAYVELFTRLWQRGLQQIELIVRDDAAAILQAAALVYPRAAHQLCLAHWFRNLEALTPPLAWTRRRKFRREFWWLWEADDERQLRLWANSFCRRWRFWAPQRVHKFRAELHRVLAYLRWLASWRHRLRTTHLAEGFFRHLRRDLGRFPGCTDAAHRERILGCFLLASEATHAEHLLRSFLSRSTLRPAFNRNAGQNRPFPELDTRNKTRRRMATLSGMVAQEVIFMF